MSEWFGIDSAPKDGTHFLAGDARKQPAYGGSYVSRWNLTFGHFETVPGKWSINPTHWMPLPDPPATD